MAFFCLLFIVPVVIATVPASTFHRRQGYHVVNNDGGTFSPGGTSKNSCLYKCILEDSCESVAINREETLCKMHSRSPLHIGFNGQENPDWNLYYRVKPWTTIAKFSASKGQFSGDKSYDLWTNPGNSMNNDSCASLGDSSSCERHYVHNEKDLILGLDTVTKIKVSLYEAGVEAAWVIFDKQPGSNDNWFQPSRVVDSYPWDTELLRSSAEMRLGPQPYDSKTTFSILKSDPGFYLRLLSPHQYWMKISQPANNCAYGANLSAPYILFSKGNEAALLSKSSVTSILKWSSNNGTGNDRYTLTWAAAENFCQTHLNVPLATYNEVDNARLNEQYQCCVRGWMTGQQYGFPMTYSVQNCGNAVGMLGTGTDPSQLAGVFCKPNQDLVGVADTVAISVNV